MKAGRVWRLAEWAGRSALLGAVAFWWGAIVGPRLFSLAFPDLLPPDAIPHDLNPEIEVGRANAVSIGALSTLALLAFGAAVGSRGGNGVTAVAGWTALAVTAAYLAWEEYSEFHISGVRGLGRMVLGPSYSTWLWPVVMSPLIVAFTLTMAVFVRKGLRARRVRAPLVLGLAAWLLAIAQETGHPVVFATRGGDLAVLLEETLEFGGALMMSLSAGLALAQAGGKGRRLEAVFADRPLIRLALGSMAAVAALALAAMLVYRGPLFDSRARGNDLTFQISLHNQQSLVQELGIVEGPVARIDLRVAIRDPERRQSGSRSGTMLWRVMEAGGGVSGRILREGRMELPARDHPSWERMYFPPLEYAEGRRLAVQLIADIEPEAHLRVAATKSNRFSDVRLWINGEPAWPDQNVEFVVYMAATPTLGKLQATWNMFISDWRWPILAMDLAVAMTLVVLVPAVLVTAALPRRGLP